MLRTVLALALLCAVPAAGAGAQQTPLPSPPPAGQTPGPVPPPPAPQRTSAQLLNVRIDITITDQRTDAAVVPKTVTLVVADRELGRIRTGSGNLLLNVDARPTIVRDGRVSTNLALEYRPRREEVERSEPASIVESLTAILDDGKALVVSQSADPSTDRKVKVELKTTVLK